MADKHRCPICEIHWTANDMCWHCKNKKESHMSPYRDVEFTTYKPRPRKQLQSDKEQAAIRKAVDDKYRLNFEFRQYLPGTPEFEAIAKTLTPVELISHKSIECQVDEVWGK